MLTKIHTNFLFNKAAMSGCQAPPAQSTVKPDLFDPVPDRNYHLDATPDAYGVRAVKTGTGPKPEWNFRWLPYVPGRIVYMPLAGTPIFTGPMSGCWLAIVKVGGVECFAHVGTDSAHGTPNSIAVVNAWSMARGAKAIEPVKAFNPAAGAYPPSAITWGALNPQDRSFFKIGLTQQAAKMGGFDDKITVVHKVASGVHESPQHW